MEIKTINQKLVSGILTLSFRRAMLYAIRYISINLVLAKVLPPATIGIFNIANSVLAFFSYFSDIGLGGAIIQKKEISKEDLKTTFSIQLILSGIILLIVWFAAPFLAEFYGLEYSGLWLIRVLAVGFFLTTFKVLPSLLLERDLRFGPLVLVEIVETLVFCSILIFLSFQNYRVEAFSYATIFQSIAGVLLIYFVAPWKITFGISKSAAKSLLNFGVPFQLNSLLALLKDRLVPLVIARMVGPSGIGFITWAQGLAYLPLEVMNIIIRVTFPAFSRLQHDLKALKLTAERSVFLTSLFLYPLLFGLLAVAPSFIKNFYPQWLPALPLIYYFAVNTFWASLSTTFTNILNATGRIGITLKLMIMWTVLTWVLTPALTYFYGIQGMGIATAIIAFTSIIPIIITKKIINIDIFKSLWQPLSASIVMAVVVYFISENFMNDYISAIVTILFGGVIYFLILYLIAWKKIIASLKSD
jgi:O-antigen/teichoic acid export membrane protein